MNEKVTMTMRQLLIRIVEGRTADLESEVRFQKFLKQLEPLKGTVSPEDLSTIERMSQDQFIKWLETLVDPERPNSKIKSYLEGLAEQFEGIDEGKVLTLTQKLKKLKRRDVSKFPWFKRTK